MEIDIERTQIAYEHQLEVFMDSFIMNCFPFEMTDAELLNEARIRTDNPYHCWSWIENTAQFCSICTLEQIIHVAETKHFPAYTVNRFEGLIGDIANGHFLRQWYPIVDEPAHMINYSTRSMFIDPNRYETDVDILSSLVGQDLVYCYSFPARDEYGNNRCCFRFSRIDYLRFAVLKTAFFTLSYIHSYPMSCFHGPFIKGVQYGYGYKNAEMNKILLPILSKYEGRIQDRLEWVGHQLENYCLLGESF